MRWHSVAAATPISETKMSSAPCRDMPGMRGTAVAIVYAALCAAALLTPAVAQAQAVDSPAPGAVVDYVRQEPGWGGYTDAALLRYVTSGPTGVPEVASGVVFTPNGIAPEGGWPVVAWDHGTAGLTPDCSLTTNRAVNEKTIVESVIDHGYAVVAPDYVGLSADSTTTHPYLNSATEATATTDIVKAAVAADPTLSSTWAVLGASQGGHAALNTGRIASAQAPRLDFRGTAALAPASNIESLFTAAGPWIPTSEISTSFAPLLAATLSGLRTTGPDVDVDSYLTPRGREVVDSVATACVNDWGTATGGAGIADILDRPLSDPAMAEALRHYMAVPASDFDRPIFIAHGTRDTTVPYPLTLTLAAQMSTAGTRYELKTYDTDHEGIVAALADALAFLDTVMNPTAR